MSDQSSSLHPDLHDSVLSDKDSASCDLKRCNNHGRCVSEGKATRCLCLPGYKGQFCEEQSRTSHPAVIIVAFCLVAAVIVAVFVFSKRYCAFLSWALARLLHLVLQQLLARSLYSNLHVFVRKYYPETSCSTFLKQKNKKCSKLVKYVKLL